MNDATTTSHGMWAEVMQSMRRDWPWLVEGLRGWQAYVAPKAPDFPGKTEVFAAE